MVMSLVTSSIVLDGVLFAAVAVGFVNILQKFIKFYQHSAYINKNFPGPPTHWLYGNLHQLGANGEMLQMMLDETTARNHTYRISLRVWEVLVACTVPSARSLLLSHQPKDLKFVYRMVQPWLVASFQLPPHIGIKFPRDEPWTILLAGENFHLSTPDRMWTVNLTHLYAVLVSGDLHSTTAVLKSHAPKDLTMAYRCLQPWLGLGLLLSGGKRWRRSRQLLTPAFHFEILKPYVAVYNRAAEKLVRKFREASKKGSVEVQRPVAMSTLEVILNCAFSYNEDVQGEGDKHPYVQAVYTVGHLVLQRFFQPWLYNDWIYWLTPTGRRFYATVRYLHSVADDVIQRRRKTLKEHPEAIKKRYLDFLDILLAAEDKDGNRLTDTEIRDEVNTFLFEGHDTTASSISWVLYSLAKHPEHQERCREEVDALLAGREESEGGEGAALQWDDLSRLDYLTLCIKEAMRLHCPVPFIARELETDMEIDGKIAPAGTVVNVNIWCLHHNPLVWPEPHEYKPERFTPENMKTMDSFAFCPFSAGPRNCIGQNFAMNEQKVIVTRILQNFELTLDESNPIEYVPELVMRARDGIKIFMKPR